MYVETTGCATCGAPSEVLDRYVLDSTDGPIEHIKVVCVRRHWYTVAVERRATRGAAAWQAMQLPGTLSA